MECWVINTTVTRKAMANKTNVIKRKTIKVHRIHTLKAPYPVVGKPT